ncbi:MAG TPA: response regulator [Bryobacteraceae bacterium]|nr:response regulator [Bryobacteraceae bacterium]
MKVERAVNASLPCPAGSAQATRSVLPILAVSMPYNRNTPFQVSPRQGWTGADKGLVVAYMPENTATVLLVDDEPVVLKILAQVLNLHGYNVLEAQDYYTALKISESHYGRIDLLVTDIALPGLNGCELSRKLLQYRPELRVLLISGYTGAEICQYYGIELGDLHFLAKPFKQGEFLRRLQVLVAAVERHPASLSPMPKTFSAGSAKVK